MNTVAPKKPLLISEMGLFLHVRSADRHERDMSIRHSNRTDSQIRTELRLESGRILAPMEIAYETYGTLNRMRSNAILVTHAWTGSAHLAGKHNPDEKRGRLVGRNRRPRQAARHRSLFRDLLQRDRLMLRLDGPTSINPKTGKALQPRLSRHHRRDMVQGPGTTDRPARHRETLCVLGGSMGGMQAMEWATQFPDRVASAVVLATTPRPSAQAISLNAVARWAISTTQLEKGGVPEESQGRPGAGPRHRAHHLSLRRVDDGQIRSPILGASDGQFDFFGQFEVERYLNYNGYSFVDRFDANSFLYLAKALDLYDVASGCESMAEAFARSWPRSSSSPSPPTGSTPPPDRGNGDLPEKPRESRSNIT